MRKIPAQDLPNELWCDIWQRLPLRDRFSVAQVCSRCRALALHTPTLWTRLDYYTTRHHANCLCAACFRDQHPLQAQQDGGRANSPYPANPSESTGNERLIRGVLERSGGLPLHLNVSIVPDASDVVTLSALATALEPHIGRIASISGVDPNGHTMLFFLSHFQCLPALRTFSLSVAPGCENMWRPDAGKFFVSHPIDLPCLVVLDLWGMGVVAWPDHLDPRLHFPALRSLALQTLHMHDVVLALRACPSVSALRFTLATDQGTPDPYLSVSMQEMREALAPVRSCRVDGVWSADEGCMFSGFSDMDPTSLVLQYVQFPARGFGILREAAPAPIRLALDGDGLVAVTAEGARIRQLIFPAKPEEPEQDGFWRIWDAARLVDGVRCVASDDAMWAAFVEMRRLAALRAESD